MKRLWLLSLIAIPFLVVRSEEPVPQGFEHWTTASLSHLNETLMAARMPATTGAGSP